MNKTLKTDKRFITLHKINSYHALLEQKLAVTCTLDLYFLSLTDANYAVNNLYGLN